MFLCAAVIVRGCAINGESAKSPLMLKDEADERWKFAADKDNFAGATV